jgi:hypothetical protein
MGVYLQLTEDDRGQNFQGIWKAKIPLKIKIFMWMVAQKAILTKDNMVARNWQGDPGCYFCESVDHLLFQCPVAKVIWATLALCFHQNNRPSSYEQFCPWIRKALPRGGGGVYMLGLAAFCWAIWVTRNKRCFEKIIIKPPHEITLPACMFLHYWAGLYSGEDQELIKVGAAMVVQALIALMNKSQEMQVARRIQDGDGDVDAEDPDHDRGGEVMDQ